MSPPEIAVPAELGSPAGTDVMDSREFDYDDLGRASLIYRVDLD